VRTFTALWLAGLAYVIGVEVAAYLSGQYANTATGHVVRIMLVHPALAVAVLAVIAAIGVHLLIDFLMAVLR